MTIENPREKQRNALQGREKNHIVEERNNVVRERKGMMRKMMKLE